MTYEEKKKKIMLTKKEREFIVKRMYGGKCWEIFTKGSEGISPSSPGVMEMSDEVDRLAGKLK